MAGAETRLMLLGAVALFEPVNGYQIRRELISWGVEDWASIRPGSIYHGLGQLAERGDLVRHDLQDGGREVAVYELSDQGRAEFQRLFAEALTEVRPTSPLAFQTACSLLPLIRRDVAVDLLGERLRRLDDAIEQHDAATYAESVPPHVLALLDYWDRTATAEREWLIRLLFRIRDGDLEFAGEPSRWQPAADDPGWQMNADRARYLGLLRR